MTVIDFLGLLIPVCFGLLTFHLIKKRRVKRQAQDFKSKMEKSIEKITEDGVVEGPKGKYVPHEKWGNRTSYRTPRDGKRQDHGIL